MVSEFTFGGLSGEEWQKKDWRTSKEGYKAHQKKDRRTSKGYEAHQKKAMKLKNDQTEPLLQECVLRIKNEMMSLLITSRETSRVTPREGYRDTIPATQDEKSQRLYH